MPDLSEATKTAWYLAPTGLLLTIGASVLAAEAATAKAELTKRALVSMMLGVKVDERLEP